MAVIVQPQKEDSSNSKYTPNVRLDIAKFLQALIWAQMIMKHDNTNKQSKQSKTWL